MTKTELRRLRVKAGIAKDKLYEIQAALIASDGVTSQRAIRIEEALVAVGRLQDALES